MQEVVSAFGEPGGQNGDRTDECQFEYLAPPGVLTAEREGYIGFEVQFEDKRVVGWRSFHGYPSYEPMHAPPEAKWIGKFYLMLFGALLLVGAVIKRVWGITEGMSLLEAFNEREIATGQIPAEFRFINHDTTLQEVIDRVGEPTQVRPLRVNPRQIKGSRLIQGIGGEPVIVIAEYELPNASAVILIPEFPFQRENRIRTAYFRKSLPGWEGQR